MRTARRDRLISSAQVAYHYSYTLEAALALSREERELLLAVVVSEQDRKWDKLESVLGVTWDLDFLVGLESDKKKGKGKKETAEQLPSQIRVPLLLALAPDFLNAVGDKYRSRYKASMEAKHITGGGPVTEIGTLTAEQAREFYRTIGAQIAKTKQEPIED